MRRGLILMLVLPAASLMVTGPRVAEAHETWTVIAGGGTKDLAVVSNFFHPRTIEIGVGDTIRWRFQGFHTVTFLSGQRTPEVEVREGDKTYINPQIIFPVGGKTYDGTGFRSSGIPPLDPSAIARFGYALTFTKAGIYQYRCLIHGRAMSGIVVVKERVTASRASVARQARREQAATIKAGQTAWANFKTERQNGAVVVPLLGDAGAGWSILRFTQKPVVVSPGTTVTWTMRDPFEIHTVTFLGGQKPPELLLVEPQKRGRPKLRLNPKLTAPTSTKTYGGVGFVNSGILATSGPGSPDFSLTFPKAGRYEYVCLVHLPEGMKGTVVVK